MNKAIITLILMLLNINLYAQETLGYKFSPREFMNDMAQYIAKDACLTPAESAKFFPLYEEMCNKKRALFDKVRQLGRNKPSNEVGCQHAIQLRDKLDLDLKRIEQIYHNKFLKVMPASKVYEVIRSEDKFHRNMFARMAKRDWRK
jgi:hypothetical protein